MMRAMDFVSEIISACRHGLANLGTQPGGLPVSLFLAGLAGSLVHCAGMCGPFVLGQVMADAERGIAGGYGEWRRLAGASLVPYHLGRLTTYTALGSVAGAATAWFTSTSPFGWFAAALLVIAAARMLMQAFGMATGISSPLARPLARLAGPLSMAETPARKAGCACAVMAARPRKSRRDFMRMAETNAHEVPLLAFRSGDQRADGRLGEKLLYFFDQTGCWH